MNFMAPEAKILVVDDNKMSLTLARNLISSFGIQVDSAQSGMNAISMLGKAQYHLVFMDYMMPQLDGVETTRLIRKMEGAYYREIPIIALTGDDMPDEELFREAGMNDYLPKPLGNPLLGTILRKWLPKELVQEQERVQKETEAETIWESEEDWFGLHGIDVAEGIKNSGGKDTFRTFLGDFYKLIDIKANLLEKYMADKLIREYTIEVHALKNSARMIGAMELSQYFQQMEQLGQLGAIKSLEEENPGLLAMYRGFKPILEPYGVKATSGKKAASVDEMIFCLRGLQDAVEAFDIDSADWAMAQLDEFRMPEECHALMEKLRAAVADVAMENILVMSEEIISFLQE